MTHASVNTNVKLPPVPESDESFFRSETISEPGAEPIHALRPARAPYINDDPNAPAIVLVPGLGMDCLGYLRQLPLGAVGDLHMVQACNEAVAGEEGLGHFVHGVETYIKRKRLEERPGGIYLGGCSMGGAVTLATAIRSKVKLRGLLLLGTFGNCRHLPKYQRVLAPLSWYLPMWGTRRVLKRLISFIPRVGNLTPKEAQWMISYKVRRTRHYYGRAVMALTRMNQIEAAKRLDLPALIVHGKRDLVLPYPAAEELASSLSNSRLIMLEDAGHALFFTHHEPINQAIAEFILSQR